MNERNEKEVETSTPKTTATLSDFGGGKPHEETKLFIENF